MRALTAVLVLALSLACGGSSPTVGSISPAHATLHVTTSGDGVVRGAGNDCRGDCTVTPVAGSQLRLEAVPDSGATFAGWSGACSGTGACQVTVDGDVSVAASFSRPAATRTLTVVVDGQGRVVSTPAGIDCSGGTCSAAFADGATVSLAAISAASSKFAGWSGGCSGSGACSVTLRGDAQVSARFDALPPPKVTLSASVTGPGQVTGGGLTCGNGASPCSALLAPGTSVTLTAAAAPQARFMGWGGACSGSGATCQVTPQSDTSVTASFEFELQTLVGNDGRNLFVLGLNSTRVFFGRSTSEGLGVWSVSKSGGMPALVAGGIPVYIVADDSFVYWTDGMGIYSAPAEGGPASLLATGNVGRLALDDEGALYWVFMRDFQGGKGALHRMQNRVDAIIASGQNQNFGVAVDVTHAYFTCSSQDGTDHAIRRVPRKGGTVETVLTTSGQPWVVRLDSQNVYYRELSGAVSALSKSGGSPRLLSAPNGSSGFIGNTELDVNASVVWWLWGDGTSAPKGLFRAKADGTGWTAVDTGSDFSWFGPRVDDTAVYYFHAGALLKRLK